MLSAATPPVADSGDPLWYLVGDLAVGGLGALGTVLALLFALREYRARQAAEQRAQAAEARERARLDVEEEREQRAQAQRITSTVRPGFIDVRNESPDPIRGLQGRVRIPGGRVGKTQDEPLVSRGQSTMLVVEIEVEERMPDAWAITFFDVAGRQWLAINNETLRLLPADGEAERMIAESLSNALNWVSP
jgi:hypothetical protein